MAARRIGVEERRARLAGRHHLAAGSGARSPVEDRELVRILGMRRTMFVVPLDLAAIVQAACTRAIAIRDRRRTIQILTQCGIADDPGAWFADLEEATVRVLATHGEGTAAELSVHEPRLRTQLLLAEGKSYAASQSVVTRVLMQLAADGRVIRGRPRGSWTSSQYRWAPIEAWLPEGVDDLPTDTARVELVRRWLTAFGPGTPADVKWWTGWTAGEVKRAVEKLGAVEVELDGATGLLLPDDLVRRPNRRRLGPPQERRGRLPAAGGHRRRRRRGRRDRRRVPPRLDRRRPRHPPLPNTLGTPAQRLRSVQQDGGDRRWCHRRSSLRRRPLRAAPVPAPPPARSRRGPARGCARRSARRPPDRPARRRRPRTADRPAPPPRPLRRRRAAGRR